MKEKIKKNLKTIGHAITLTLALFISFALTTITIFSFAWMINSMEFADCIVTTALLWFNVIFDVETFQYLKNKIFI